MAQDEHIVPIPGTKRRRYLEENIGAQSIALTPHELDEINAIFPPHVAAGERYGREGMATIDNA
ncbi:hypothetical protein DZS_10420 [Dickeya ananatis]